jgi:hypothetical protein
MDGGSSLNNLYAHTLRLMGIGLDQLWPGTTSFHGVVPGKRIQPLGQIDLPIWFGTPDNFRKETLTLLGYIISQRGIEPNPEKVTALDLRGPIRDLKGVQKVLGCLATLSRFISRLCEKGLPLYRLLKKHEHFSWTVEAQEALDKLKATLSYAPILTPPQGSEPLYLYIDATTQVVSTVIVVERTEEGHALPFQRPVYYVSEVLSETKVRYP